MRGLFESLYSCGNTSILLIDVTNISHLLLPFQNQTQFCGFACALYLSCRYGQTISNSCITNYFNGVHWKQELERRLFYILCVNAFGKNCRYILLLSKIFLKKSKKWEPMQTFLRSITRWKLNSCFAFIFFAQVISSWKTHHTHTANKYYMPTKLTKQCSTKFTLFTWKIVICCLLGSGWQIIPSRAINYTIYFSHGTAVVIL